MKNKEITALGPLEEEIMAYLWNYEQGSVRDVMMAIRKKRQIAYTTVMTVMGRLQKKGILVRKRKSNAFVYSAAIDRRTFFQETAAYLSETLLNQCGDVAIAQFIDTLDSMDSTKLLQLQEELNKHLNPNA